MHAFSGNDFMSSFFRKSKVHCWKIMKTSDEFEEAFKLLGNSKGCHDTLLECLKKYVCKLYGFSDTSVNRVRFKIFEKKNTKKITKLLIYGYCHHVAVLLDFTFYARTQQPTFRNNLKMLL